METSQRIIDFIEWAEWWLCGSEWTSSARRCRYRSDFDATLHGVVHNETTRTRVGQRSNAR